MKVSGLFRDPPDNWGLRGDPYMWRELQSRLLGVELPDTDEELLGLVEEQYVAITGQSLENDRYVFIEDFAHGGMSSGHVCPEYWRERGLPLLVKRFSRFKAGDEWLVP